MTLYVKISLIEIFIIQSCLRSTACFSAVLCILGKGLSQKKIACVNYLV